ncbi:hypothetical protein HMPREF1624_00519 [Sporothrix schenckii ATCC 58251]|uniref:CobW/HypB/UreG nucleotide-binding domain-containing protein n=1 Tax=Sporothrix schenckii (strain ATCC 58251 / de Perez 2211183) TaxID=1391915 RepID=U7Q669_SPOS1|nr:hypothetical protein HMPREF1624_00519 [Sporothrix schenckii ATCC 58251]
MAPIPITIVTGFLGSGKTTLILNLIPQLRAANPNYRLALLKNEFGDLAVDSQLAASSAVAGVRELLNGCICCNLVGQLGDALEELTADKGDGAGIPSRIVVETSGSAFPATLALEVNRLARATGGRFALDGVVSVIDVENWAGYEDTSYTAKLQARYTDLIVFNKWEACNEQRFDVCLDRLGDLHTDDVAWVKSRRGWVDAGLVFGVDGGLLAKALGDGTPKLNGDSNGHANGSADGHDHSHNDDHEHKDDHQSEVEVLSVTLKGDSENASVDVAKLSKLLSSASKDEVYRIKAVLSVDAASASQLANSDDSINVNPSTEETAETSASTGKTGTARYILNWAFGRWTITPVAPGIDEHALSEHAPLRMTMILARYESTKWTKKLQTGDFVALAGDAGAATDALAVTKIA